MLRKWRQNMKARSFMLFKPCCSYLDLVLCAFSQLDWCVRMSFVWNEFTSCYDMCLKSIDVLWLEKKVLNFAIFEALRLAPLLSRTELSLSSGLWLWLLFFLFNQFWLHWLTKSPRSSKRWGYSDNMETKNETSDVSRAEEMKNQANEAFKGLYFCLKHYHYLSMAKL